MILARTHTPANAGSGTLVENGSGEPSGRDPSVDQEPTRGGHQHFWERALTRREALASAAAGGAAVALTTTAFPITASAQGPPRLGPPFVYPKPIPGGMKIPPPVGTGKVFHLFLPGPGKDPSVITDFDGFVGLSHIGGKGTGTDLRTGKRKTLVFDADMRFMKGAYVGVDGKRHFGTFAFV
jgi:hypothetical protein